MTLIQFLGGHQAWEHRSPRIRLFHVEFLSLFPPSVPIRHRFRTSHPSRILLRFNFYVLIGNCEIPIRGTCSHHS
uniref:Uncharacterized protein n=1 Tax=Physcomitrium patens TaxID=3218 RepID=A0A2K1JHJ4_PHYPA|nr:hypothetical protein PHYPA_018392 [Physcomitrium patens]